MDKTGSKYSDADRRAAVAEFIVLGNISATSRATGIPRRTIGTWTQSDWWVPLEAELRQQIDDEILANIYRKSVRTGIGSREP